MPRSPMRAAGPMIAGPLSPGARARPWRRCGCGSPSRATSAGGERRPGGRQRAGMFDTHWTPDLTAAVKRFQARHGLKETGVVAGATLKAMNVPARVALHRTRLERAAARRPAVQLRRPLRGGQHPLGLGRGGGERPGGTSATWPWWAIRTIPRRRSTPRSWPSTSTRPGRCRPRSSRTRSSRRCRRTRAIWPGRRSASSTAPATRSIPPSIDWTSQRATNYILRQDSGTANSLGSIRINMPNKFAVYMHDTPSKRFFGGDYRFLSHGCVRVQGVYDLAAWLLEGTRRAGRAWDARGDREPDRRAAQHKEVRLAQARAGRLGVSDRLGQRGRRRCTSATTSMASTRSARARRPRTKTSRRSSPEDRAARPRRAAGLMARCLIDLAPSPPAGPGATAASG